MFIRDSITVVLILLAVALLIAVANIRIVPQAYVFVVERLGRYYTTWPAGVHVKVPFIDRVAKKVSLKEQVVDFTHPPVICLFYTSRPSATASRKTRPSCRTLPNLRTTKPCCRSWNR